MAKKPAKQADDTQADATAADNRKSAAKKKPAGKNAAKPAKQDGARKRAAPKAKKATNDAPREKRVRGEFALPHSDYALIAKLKTAAKNAGRPTKKNELLRAGLRALDAMDAAGLNAALGALPARKEKV